MSDPNPESDDRLVRFVMVGHVDHGKSTLIGRLLFDTGNVPDSRREQVAAAASHRGTAFEWAHLMDALQAERDQNVTIDTAQVWLRDGTRNFTIIDAPGHRAFLRNMVTGAARADAACLLIDAAEGVRDQTRRHGALLQLLGIHQVIVVVSKMDQVDYAQDAFERARADTLALLASVGITPMATVPVASRDGDNVVNRSPHLDWFNGGTLLEAIRQFVPLTPVAGQPFRMPVQDVYRFDHRRVIVGRVESGTLSVGDEVIFGPGGQRSRIRTLECWPPQDKREAGAGESVGITLSEPLFIERGAVVSAGDDPATTARTFRARLFWLGPAPLEPGRPYRLKLATREVECEIDHIHRVVDAGDLSEAVDSGSVPRDCVADVTVRARRPIAIDRFDRVPATGRFVLVDGLDIAGGGVVESVEALAAGARGDGPVLVRSVGDVSLEDREDRHGHRGAVIWLTGLSGAGKSTIASSLERTLFDRGLETFVLDGDNVRFGLNSDLRFSQTDRAENIRRVAEVAKLFAESGAIVITALISPYKSDRERARQIVREGGLDLPFFEVYLEAPLEVCETRDPKGLYRRARTGQIQGFTGISAPYEVPADPDISLPTGDATVESCVERVVEVLLPAIATGRIRP